MNTIKLSNPFVVGHYESAEFFCDRKKELEILIKHIENGRNVTLTSPRRLGKTGLISHLFAQEEIKERYYTFFVELYATSSLAEFVALMGKVIYEDLKKREEKWFDKFVKILTSLRAGLKMDSLTGNFGFDIGLGDISSPTVSLDEIFDYLEKSDRHCIVAIDEFQQIVQYDENNVEALLRTKIQQCKNVTFVFTGSKRHLMTQMFYTKAKPFYQSTIGMELEPIEKNTYTDFALSLFEKYGKKAEPSVVQTVYEKFHGYTWYLQMVMNELFFMTNKGETCTIDIIEPAVANIISSQAGYYKNILSTCGTKQRAVLIALANEEMRTRKFAEGITTSDFIKKYSLPSASSVQAAVKGLVDKNIVTPEDNSKYHIDDLFLTEYICNGR